MHPAEISVHPQGSRTKHVHFYKSVYVCHFEHFFMITLTLPYFANVKLTDETLLLLTIISYSSKGD